MGRIRPFERTQLAIARSRRRTGRFEPTASLSDRSTAIGASDASDAAAESVSDELPGGTPYVPPGDEAEREAERPVWPVAGTLLTVLGAGLGLAAGFDVFAPGTAPLENAVAYGLLLPYYLVSLKGTLWIVDDAERLSATDAAWQPSPWPYVAAGGLLVAAGLLAALGVSMSPLAAFVRTAVGALVVGTPIAAVVTGPLYLLRRSRKLGTS